MPVFRVVQKQVPGMQFVGQLSCLQCRAVVFLVRFENIPVTVEAEGFAHHLVCLFRHAPVQSVERFVSQAYDRFSLRQRCPEIELFFLGGMDVETFHPHAVHVKCAAVFHLARKEAFPPLCHQLLRQGQPADFFEHMQCPLVAVDAEHALAGVVALLLHDGACHPHCAEDVVRVCMGEEHVVNVGQGDARLLQLGQHSVAPARVHQQVALALQYEAGV